MFKSTAACVTFHVQIHINLNEPRDSHFENECRFFAVLVGLLVHCDYLPSCVFVGMVSSSRFLKILGVFRGPELL